VAEFAISVISLPGILEAGLSYLLEPAPKGFAEPTAVDG
jgi:hypothetical protein